MPSRDPPLRPKAAPQRVAQRNAPAQPKLPPVDETKVYEQPAQATESASGAPAADQPADEADDGSDSDKDPWSAWSQGHIQKIHEEQLARAELQRYTREVTVTAPDGTVTVTRETWDYRPAPQPSLWTDEQIAMLQSASHIRERYCERRAIRERDYWLQAIGS